MKKLVIGTTAASLLALSGAINAQVYEDDYENDYDEQRTQSNTSDFEGLYFGAKTGWSRMSLDDYDNGDVWVAGAELGYNWGVSSNVIFGLNAFYDYNDNDDVEPDLIGDTLSIGTHGYGVDGKLGYVAGSAMYYAKLGVVWLEGRRDLDEREEGLHGGLGVEFKLNPDWSLTGEWLYSEADIGPAEQELNTHNFTIGVNYNF